MHRPVSVGRLRSARDVVGPASGFEDRRVASLQGRRPRVREDVLPGQRGSNNVPARPSSEGQGGNPVKCLSATSPCVEVVATKRLHHPKGPGQGCDVGNPMGVMGPCVAGHRGYENGPRYPAIGEGRPNIPGLVSRSGTEARPDGVSECDPDTGSTVGPVLGDDRAAMGTNDRRNDCQTETGAAVVSGPAGV